MSLFVVLDGADYFVSVLICHGTVQPVARAVEWLHIVSSLMVQCRYTFGADEPSTGSVARLGEVWVSRVKIRAHTARLLNSPKVRQVQCACFIVLVRFFFWNYSITSCYGQKLITSRLSHSIMPLLLAV